MRRNLSSVKYRLPSRSTVGAAATGDIHRASSHSPETTHTPRAIPYTMPASSTSNRDTATRANRALLYQLPRCPTSDVWLLGGGRRPQSLVRRAPRIAAPVPEVAG